MTPIHPNSDQSNNGMMHFISGKEGTPASSLNDNRNITLLGISSLIISILFGCCIALLMNAYIDNGMVSFGIFILISFLLLLINKMLFQFQSQPKGKLAVTLIYIIFYLVLSYVAIVHLMTFYYLQSEINAIKKSESTISMFSAMIHVISNLEFDQKKSLQQFQFICFGISALFSQMPLFINYLILQNRTSSHPEFQLENMKLEIQHKIQKKQQEYIALFETVSQDNGLLQEETSDDDRKESAQRLLQEIEHLKQSLNYL